MRINVKLFAILRDKAGTAEVAMDVRADSTASEVASVIAARYPSIADYLKRSAFAVNREYAPGSTRLNDGDELALIPPVSGG
jgi:molybdopterin synthase catalytic subunit